MHGSIRERLEELLAARGAVGEKRVAKHLASCAECSDELMSMQAQAALLRTLRPSDDMEPAPGFYARVMQRIEERAKDSIWAGLLYSPFAKRLVYASLTLAVMLGTYVIAQEARDGHLGYENTVAQSTHTDPPVFGDQAQQRDAVLANFAAHTVQTSFEPR